MKKVLFGLAVIGVSGVLALPASAATTTHIAHVSGIAFNSCTGELMWVESKIVQVTRPETGPLYEIFHQSQHGVATGLTTGQRYIFNSVSAGTRHVANGFVVTITSHHHVTAPGRGADLRLHTTFHTRITETGELVVFFDKIEFECSGTP